MFFFAEQDLASRDADLSDSLREFVESGRLSLADLDKFLGRCRAGRPDMTMGMLQTFLFVAKRDAADSSNGTHLAEISEALEISYPSTARMVDALSDGARGKPGLNWICKQVHEGTRVRSLHLSKGGVQVLRILQKPSAGAEALSDNRD